MRTVIQVLSSQAAVLAALYHVPGRIGLLRSDDMSGPDVPSLPSLTFIRGRLNQIQLPAEVTINGVEIDYESTGYVQLQYRASDGTGTPTRWKTNDGASRYEAASNSFLVPDDDSILGGEGDLMFDYDIDYFDASGDPTLVGRHGRILVIDAETGAPE